MSTIYYHFTGNMLRDGRAIPSIGEWLEFDGTPVPCKSGLHASPDAFDALQYAPGTILHQVELGGKIVATINAEAIMRLFARRVALDVIHLWDAPTIVKEYLETGDESKRNAAGAAAAAAAGAAASWDAAWGTAGGAKQKLYRGWFNEMVETEFALQAVRP